MKKTRSVNQRMEKKTLPVFVTKVDGALGEVEAIVNVYGIVDMQRDIVHMGSFAKTISESYPKIRVLDQHNTYSILNVIGLLKEIREVGRTELPLSVTSKFPDATGGLYVRIQFLMNTPEGLGAFQRIEAGAVDEFSIAFEALDIDYSEVVVEDGKKMRVRNLRTCKLWEVSAVIWGANQATAVTGMKNNEKEMTPDGPLMRLGDFLHAEALKCVCGYLSSLYSSGYLDSDEWAQLDGISRRHFDSMRVEYPEDLALRPLSYSSYYYLMINRSGVTQLAKPSDSLQEVPDAQPPKEPVETIDPEEPKASEEPVDRPDGTPPDGKAEALQLRARKVALRIRANSLN